MSEVDAGGGGKGEVDKEGAGKAAGGVANDDTSASGDSGSADSGPGPSGVIDDGLGISGSGVFDLVVPDWPAPVNVRAFSTTRKGGISRAQWRSLNLGRNCGDDRASVQKNRILLRTLLPSQPVWLKQVHGVQVFDLDRRFDKVDEVDVKASGGTKAKAKPGPKTAATRAAAAAASVAAASADLGSAAVEADLGFDAAFTATAGQVCAVLTADCLPVVFCNKAGTRVAVAHAGWRGLAEGVLEATIAAMGCDASDIIAWMGPAIGPEAFEVGRDVYEAFCAVDAENAISENIGAFKPHGDRWLADLYMLARLALARVGVTEVFGGEHCTYSNAERFFSYRRDQETGRMATIVWFEPT